MYLLISVVITILEISAHLEHFLKKNTILIHNEKLKCTPTHNFISWNRWVKTCQKARRKVSEKFSHLFHENSGTVTALLYWCMYCIFLQILEFWGQNTYSSVLYILLYQRLLLSVLLLEQTLDSYFILARWYVL